VTAVSGAVAEVRPVGAAPQAAPHRDAHHCITGADAGDPMTVVAIDAARGLAWCAAADGTADWVEIALVAPVALGGRLLVHAGTAIAHLPAAPADDVDSADLADQAAR
jgi:hydrogenase maturation factor